jgi:hypothetical protein
MFSRKRGGPKHVRATDAPPSEALAHSLAADDELGDAVPPGDLDRVGPVVVDQDHEDLAAVAGVDRTGRVEHRHTEPGGQAGARVDQTHVTVRNGQGDPGPHRRAGAREQLDLLGRDQVGAGVTRVGVGRQRQVGVEPAQVDD